VRVLLLLLLLVSCGEKVYNYSQSDTVISNKNQFSQSTTAGNLITTAIRQVNQIDVVLYPTEYLFGDTAGLLSKKMNSNDIENIMSIYPSGKRDQFRIGYMSGEDIKTFIRARTMERFKVDFEVAGVSYDIMLKGGVVVSEQYGFENSRLNDNQKFLVAISDNLIRPGDVFPPYLYRNSIDRIFDATDIVVSAKESLKKFLDLNLPMPLMQKVRARVKQSKALNLGAKKIHQIQDKSFMSPYLGNRVTTQGIVTAVAQLDQFPGGYVAYLQSDTPDKDARTSEGIKLYYEEDPKLKVGDKVVVQGIVYEESTNVLDGLTTTALRDILSTQVLSSNHSLPKAVELKKIPQKKYSRYVGDLNRKSSLDLKDAIDFWESLEGMRVKIFNPKIVGFRGGKETFADEKRNLTLFAIPETAARKLRTPRGGVFVKPDKDEFNPDMVTIASGPLTPNLNINAVYKMGEIIDGEIEGIITYTKNLFGEGEYLFQIPQESKAIADFNASKEEVEIVSLEKRPRANYKKEERTLSIASYNIKNLSAISDTENQKRLQKTAEMINTNLKCPDILGLVEIQDNNGEDFSSGSQAQKTIQQLIKYIPKNGECEGVKYQAVNIDPLSHREGGVPGANIRVALIFNKNRLEFTENPLPTPLTETIVLPSGDLNYNPGRVFPNSEAFKRTRKSIVTQFHFRGQPVFIIVNHFNSKLGDISHFSSVQPIVRTTEIKRAQLAKQVNTFVSMIEKRNPNALVAAIGDFNAYVNEIPMKVLEGDILYNTIRELPRNQWYTTNHNGNSQALDYIFVNRRLNEKLNSFQIPQINSDYMGRLSDHDPVISIFKF
jgi:predicted extracellular nuclease